ncbi:MAG: glycosyltransferase family 1 protein, partial [Planctomycetota bacterium]
PSVVEHLHRRAGIPRDRLRLVRGGIDPRRIEQAEPIDRSALDVPTGVPLIVWTGRLDAVKGLPFLVEAVARLERDPPPHLLLVGDGPMREPIREQVRRLGVEDRVHLAGLRDDVPGILKSADLFTFPSRTEGLPNALLEAMAAALPVVATDVPGCRDLIEHERTGLLVPYGDTPALCDALRRLLKEPLLARRLGKAAAREVSTSWHLDRTFDAYEALYREAMQPPSR